MHIKEDHCYCSREEQSHNLTVVGHEVKIVTVNILSSEWKQ